MLRRLAYALRCVQLFVLVLVVCAVTSRAQTTTFTYQGRLQDGGGIANGSYDFQFTLWDALSAGVQQPQPSPVTVTRTNVAVSGGVFTVQLDFGASAFPGADRFLETSVRQAGAGAFTLLSPRQPITPTPYALRSLSTTTADALSSSCVNCVTSAQIQSVQGSQINGPIPVADVPAGSANYIQNSTNQQPVSNFNIDGSGTAGGTLSGNIVNAATQFNLGGSRAFVVTGAAAFPTGNTFAGVDSGTANSPQNGGVLNTFFGGGSGRLNSTGAENSFFGALSGRSNTTGAGNSYFGDLAGASNTIAANGSFFGSGAGFSNTTGLRNSFFGQQSGNSNDGGSNNSFFGSQSGQASVSGSNNSFFGVHSGFANISGSNNTIVGANADLSGNGLTNSTTIGAYSRVDESNALILGGINGVNGATADTAVGIGTTTPNSFIGGPARLAIMQRTSGQWTQHIRTNNFSPGNSFGLLIDAGTSLTDRAFRIRGQNGGDLFSVRGDGLVGIGTDTPGAQLHISSNNTGSTALTLENLVGAASRQLILSNYGSTGGGLYWTGLDSANTSSLLGPNLFVLRSTGGLAFSGSSAAEHMRISTSGTVGIGTDSPIYRLHVNQTTPNTFAAHIQTTGLATGSSYGLIVSAGTDVTDSAVQIRDQSGNPIMRIRGNGDVGIGTTNPSATLEVRGLHDGNAFAAYDRFGVAHLLINEFGLVLENPIFLGGVPFGGSTPLCATSGDQLVHCSSSLRYKKNIGRFRSGLDIIGGLKPITFEWKDGGMHDLGLAAEDVEKTEPLLVTYNKVGQVEGVKYDRIGVVLINAVKEQQAQIEKQQEQLKRQQEQIKHQEDQAKQQRAAFAAQQQQIDALKKLVCRKHPRTNARRMK